MANYKEIQGFPIQNLTTDPTPYAQALADNPYGGVWGSGGSLNTSRQHAEGAGDSTAALAISGSNSTGIKTEVESYNGSSWTEVTDVNTGRQEGASTLNAPYTDVLFFSGTPSTPTNGKLTEQWNGSAWTEVADLNTARDQGAGAGSSSTAALMISGGVPPAISTAVEQWNGSAWTEVAEVNTGRRENPGAGGTSTSAIFAGGFTPSPGFETLSESWNGSAWTETADLNTGRRSFSGAGASNTSALVYGGNTPPNTGATESWDGSSWTEVNDLSTARSNNSGGGTATNAIAAGGYSTTWLSNTEEWTFSGLPPSTPAAGYSDAIVGQMYYNSTTGQFKAIKDGGAPIGTWASGGSTNTEAGQRGGASRSSTTNAFVSGGFRMGVPDTTTNAESYDGTSWTEGPNQPATNRIGAAWGTTISYVTAGGSTGISGAPINPYAFEWNGTSFSNGGTMNNARRNAAGAGVSETAGRAMAGGDNPGPAQAFNESYDGTSFTEETDVNTARIRPIGFGTTTSAIIASGSSGTNVEQWNGSSWTEIAEVVNAVQNSAGGAGTTTDGLIFTNASPGSFATTQFWNGSSWTEVAELTVGRYANTGGGAGSTNAISVGGYGPPTAVTTSTEEWSAGDFDITTLTTS